MLNTKYFNPLVSRTIFLTVFTSLFIANVSVFYLKNNKASAQTTSYQNADPHCYFQTEDGRKLNLGALCNGKSKRIPVLNNQKEYLY